jgi:hypothetical protein
MITTFIAMRSVLRSKWVAGIIGIALLLTGCNAPKLAYNNAPQLTWWYLDSYFDVAGDAAPRVKESIEQWFVWHRKTQLHDYAGFMSSVAARAEGPLTAAQICGFYDQMRKALEPAFERGYDSAADLVPLLGPAQIATLEKKLAKDIAEYRKDYLQADPDVRRKAALKRSVDRAENFYGRLNEAQRTLLEAALAASPFDPQVSLAERERRQRDLLAALRQWVAEKADRATIAAGIRRLAQRAVVSPDPAYRQYAEKLTEFGCRTSAELHNSTTPKQRQAMRKQLKEWEETLQSLAGQAPPG